MNKRLDHNKRTEAFFLSNLTAAALGLTILNTNVVKADSVQTAQETAQKLDKNQTETTSTTNSIQQDINQDTSVNHDEISNSKNDKKVDQNENVDSSQGISEESPSKGSAGNDKPEAITTKPEDKITTKSLVKSKWGNVDVDYDTDTKTVTVHGNTDKDNPTIVNNPGPLCSSINAQNSTNASKAKKIIFDGHFKIVGAARSVFISFSSLTDIEGLENLDTSEVTNMYAWFCKCSSLTHLDLSSLNTSQVENMASMFEGCTKLRDLNISKFDTSQVTDMSFMFTGCNSLEELNLKNFNTSKVRDMSFMFAECSGLNKLDVSSFDTSNVENMSYMFNYCASLPTIDLHNFNTSKVTDMTSMFSMYYYQFSGTGQVFGWDTQLTSLDLSSFDTSNVRTMAQMFFKCTKLQSLNISSFNTSQVQNMENMFNGCRRLSTLDLRNFNTANVTSMESMFRDTRDLINLDLSSFNTAKVKNMGSMFYHYDQDGKLKTLDISNFDMRNVENCGFMLYGLNELLVLKLGNNVKDFPKMELKTPGIWLNVGTGTIQQPEARDKWSSEELMKNWNGEEETYVREVTLKVHYQDENGKSLAPDETITGTYDTSYEAKAKEIPGYMLITRPKNASGRIGENTDDITFVYQEIANNGRIPIKVGNVTVHYEDENGNQLIPNVILSGNIGDSYQTEAKSISGYTLKSKPNNATGFFTSQNQNVVYIYTKNTQNTQNDKQPENDSKNNSNHSSDNTKSNRRKNSSHKTSKKANEESKLINKRNKVRRQVANKSSVAKEKTGILVQTGRDGKSQVGILLLGVLAIGLSLFGVKIESKNKK